MVAWLVGDRSPKSATIFMKDLASRVSGKIQLTTDGHGTYLGAVRAAFSFLDVDYAQVVKKYGQLGTTELGAGEHAAVEAGQGNPLGLAPRPTERLERRFPSPQMGDHLGGSVTRARSAWR